MRTTPVPPSGLTPFSHNTRFPNGEAPSLPLTAFRNPFTNLRFGALDSCVTSRRYDERNVWKIGAITGSISRHQRPLLDLGMGSDIEIGQRRGLRAATTTIFQKGLCGDPPSGVRQRQPPKNRRIKPFVQVGSTRKSRCQFSVDDWIDENRSLRCDRAKLVFRPREPCRVGGRDVQQHVGIEKFHSSPRVRAITFAVVSPERAAPRARCSQLSTGGGVPRLTRSVSSQQASSSTCGAGSFSMASSISAMLLMAGI